MPRRFPRCAARPRKAPSSELIAPAVGGITTSDGGNRRRPPERRRRPLGAVRAIGCSLGRRRRIAGGGSGRPDFVTDAHAHAKFIGYGSDAEPLFAATGLSALADEGYLSLGARSAAAFVEACRALRLWSARAPEPR